MSEQLAKSPRVLSNPRAKGKRNPMILAIEVAFGILVLGALVIGSMNAIQQSDAEQVVDVGVPKSLLDLKLESTLTGQQAIDSITKLHGADVKLADAVIADYRANEVTAELWVGDAGTQDAARSLMDLMTRKIGGGNSYFFNPKTIQVDGQTVYTLSAQDQMQHYYYQAGNKVIWLAFPAYDHPEAALKAVLMLVK